MHSLWDEMPQLLCWLMFRENSKIAQRDALSVVMAPRPEQQRGYRVPLVYPRGGAAVLVVEDSSCNIERVRPPSGGFPENKRGQWLLPMRSSRAEHYLNPKSIGCAYAGDLRLCMM
jgi:hypothetical protein